MILNKGWIEHGFYGVLVCLHLACLRHKRSKRCRKLSMGVI